MTDLVLRADPHRLLPQLTGHVLNVIFPFLLVSVLASADEIRRCKFGGGASHIPSLFGQRRAPLCSSCVWHGISAAKFLDRKLSLFREESKFIIPAYVLFI
jgi:hypothetical protein